MELRIADKIENIKQVLKTLFAHKIVATFIQLYCPSYVAIFVHLY